MKKVNRGDVERKRLRVSLISLCFLLLLFFRRFSQNNDVNVRKFHIHIYIYIELKQIKYKYYLNNTYFDVLMFQLALTIFCCGQSIYLFLMQLFFLSLVFYINTIYSRDAPLIFTAKSEVFFKD